MAARGYSTNQFYELPRNVGRIDTTYSGNRNKRFDWPGGTRKVLNDKGEMVDETVKRGFMRMLPQISDPNISVGSWATRQCFFQFNPQTIRRNVQMRQDMMNPLLQSPEQFAVPVPGNAVFAFDLMFDRSFEMNRQPITSGLSSSGYRDMFNASASTDENADILLDYPPSQIGVLYDLRILDGIIGQGISSEMIDYVTARGELIENQYQAGVSTNPSNTDTNASDTTDAPTYTYDASTVRSNLNLNVGNQAFLIPNPVRVVFSSLFMVDGYINGMDVAFVKFNHAMVPMQVVLSVTMQALYIGFAREKTFLTESLKSAQVQPAVSNPASASDLVTYLTSPGSDISSFRIVMDSALSSPGNWDSLALDVYRKRADEVADLGIPGNHAPTDPGFYGEQPAYGPKTAYVDGDDPVDGIYNIGKRFPGVCGESEYKFNFGFPDIPKNTAINLTSQSPTPYDDINSRWQNSTSKIKSIKYQWSMSVWRKPVTTRNESSDVKIAEWVSDTYEATDASSWNNIRRNTSKPLANVAFTNKNSGRKLFSGVTDAAWVAPTAAYKDFLKPIISSGNSRIRKVFWANISVTVTVSDGSNTLNFVGQSNNIPIGLDGAIAIDIQLAPPTIADPTVIDDETDNDPVGPL